MPDGATGTGIGAAVKRVEDFRFLTGQGNYTDDINRPGHAHAYLSDRKLLSAGFEWINPHSYQLITAGLDEDFGIDVFDNNNNFMFKRYTSGVLYVAGDLDNVTNFSRGTLEDAIP